MEKIIKEELRKFYLQARTEHPPEERQQKSLQITENFLALPEVRSSSSFLLYASVPGEAETHQLIKRLIGKGARVALPLIKHNDYLLNPHWISSLETLEKGALGIPVPPPDSEAAREKDFDLIVVPGVAFDFEGCRLGMGAGYYDRFLPNTGAVTVGLAYEFQLHVDLPHEEHDRKIDILVTEQSTLRF